MKHKNSFLSICYQPTVVGQNINRLLEKCLNNTKMTNIIITIHFPCKIHSRTDTSRLFPSKISNTTSVFVFVDLMLKECNFTYGTGLEFSI